ncbi:MAG: superoxide dismutase [Oscillospiraceae bacterium]|nr:superoxide dismutase [Oscillospiraceae bacterium]
MKCYPFALFELPYAYNALEPHIDELTMHLHHDRHLKSYTDKLNAALKPYEQLHNKSLEWLVCNAGTLQGNARKANKEIAHNAGGVYNHIYYFAGLSPKPEGSENNPEGRFARGIIREFGTWELFAAKFKACAIELFGSGYLWLALDRQKRLKIVKTHNQETPLARGFCPLFCIDLWEHAYYLKHYNDRGAYIDDWFAVLNMEFAQANYEAAKPLK